MNAKQKAAENTAVLDELLASEIEVDIGETGKRLKLHRPSRAQLVALRQSLMDNQDKLKEDQDLDTAIRETEQIVSLCVPGLKKEQVLDLVMVAGGEASELVATCFRLCGLVREELSKDAQRDPTSTSSPEQQDAP